MVTDAVQNGDAMSSTLSFPPELGPHIVFFTGGTALRHISQHLAELTHNSVHLVTPFDSGGSSATLRQAFGMPAVGDIRNRLLDLADTSFVPNAVLDLCHIVLQAECKGEGLLQVL